MKWKSHLAYAVGLITTDGNLSKDGRHLNLTSKDLEQIKTFARILGLKNKIGLKSSSFAPTKKYYQIQFGNVAFYKFLLNIGLTPNKSKTLGSLKIPDKYFADFLRGHLDGDGCTYSYWDRRWKKSFMFYLVFMSASLKHLEWLQNKINHNFKAVGKISKHRTYYHLRFAKKESLILINKMYHGSNIPSLGRKRFKIEKALGIMRNHAGVLELVDRPA